MFFDRFWWIQYIVWASPWFAMVPIYFASTGRGRAHFAGYFVFIASYFLATLALFPHHNHYFRAVRSVTEGLVLPRALSWGLVSAFCVTMMLVGGYGAITAMRGRAEPVALELDARFLRTCTLSSALGFGAWIIWYLGRGAAIF